jgi:hypothetical protein
MGQVGLQGSFSQMLLRVERAAVSSALRNPVQETPQLPMIRIHGGAGFAAQRCNELFKQRAGNPHFGASLFLVRVFACHLGVYTHAGADFPIQFATESMFRDDLSSTSCFGSFCSFDERFEEFFTLCDTLISRMH